MAIAGRIEGHGEMHLLQILDLAALRTFEGGGLEGRGGLGLHAAKDRLGLCHDGIVINTSRSGQDHLTGAIMFRDKPLQVVARERGNPLFRPKDGAAKGLVGVRRLLQPVKDDVVGRVQSLPDFLQDHMTFNLDLLLVEGRVQHDVADNIQRKFHVVLQHAGVIGRHLARGIGVDIAAHILDFLGNLQRRAAFRAFERHMLQKMRDAVLFGPLMPPARHDPDARAGRFQPGHMFGDNAETVGQRGQAKCQRAVLSRTRAWISARSFGTRVTRSGRSNRSAMRGGNAGRTPIAACTASGNLAGCAVARVIIGVAP